MGTQTPGGKEAVPSDQQSRLLRRLLLAKYLYGLGREGLSSSTSSLKAAVTLLLMHDSVEIFQIAVLEKIGAPVSGHRNFMDFWELVKVRTNTEPPYKGLFEAFNKLRVQLKHYGNLPDPLEVRDLCGAIPHFYSEVTGKFLGLDFSTISLADLLEDDPARAHMKKAETAMRTNDSEAALAEAGMAFQVLIRDKDSQPPQYLSPGHGLEFFKEASSTPSRSDIEAARKGLPSEASSVLTAIGKACQRLQAQIDEMKRSMELAAWGVDLQKYRKFRYLTPHVLMASSGVMQVISERTHPILVNRENADFCFQFVIESGLRIQEQKFRLPDPHSLHRLKVIASPARLYSLQADDSLRVTDQIAKEL